jgi:hypothetical protein
MATRNVLAVGVMFIGVLAAPAVGMAQVFQDSFDTENGGVGALNFAAFTKWTVSDGFVDLIGNNFFDSFPGNGLYVDLDGSNANAGILTSTSFAVVPGSYTLEFQLGLNGGFGNDNMTVSLGSAFNEVFDAADAGASPNFVLISRTFPVASAGNVNLVFSHAGGDDFGLIIDDVNLTLVPEPTALAAVACAGVLAVRTRPRSVR